MSRALILEQYLSIDRNVDTYQFSLDNTAKIDNISRGEKNKLSKNFFGKFTCFDM
jgi:hypothetical protein